MVLGPHMLVGSALAVRIGNPLLGIPAAIASHYLLDAMPHAEYRIDKLSFLRSKTPLKAAPLLAKISCDIGFALLAILLSAHYGHQSLALAAAGGIAGILPDFTTFLYFLFPGNAILRAHIAFHHRIHFPKQKTASPILRYGLQIAAVVFSILAVAVK